MKNKTVSKLDLAVIAIAIAAGTLLIEHRHRTVIEAPAQPDHAALASAPACPDNDNVPYSASCLSFLRGATASGMQWRITAVDGAIAAPAWALK